MTSSNVWDFVWQYKQRKKWVTFSEEEVLILNKSVKEHQKSVLLPSKSARKKIAVDFEKMVQRNRVTSYKQKVRCLVFNSGFFVWLWRDEFDDWHCFKPYLSCSLEIAYHKREKKLHYYEHGNYEVNLEIFEQVNKDDLSTNHVKRESIEIRIAAQLKKICSENEVALQQACGFAAPKAKRIRLDSSITDVKVKMKLPTFNPLDTTFPEKVRKMPSNTVSVDFVCPLRENYHIYCEGTDIYTAILIQTSLLNKNDKYFYTMQLLENNHTKQLAVWRRWGCVGKSGHCDFLSYENSLPEAKAFFDDKFYLNTKNHWIDRKNFVHCQGRYDLLRMDLNPEEKSIEKVTKTDVKSKLDPKLQSLLELICDQKRMEEMMKEMSYDSNKTPLGKLTPKQVRDGYLALHTIATVLSSGERGSKLLSACNDFYTKIPHNFGMKTPPIIQTQSQINEKIKMIEALANITVAMGVLNSMSNKEEHPLDKYYSSLNCLLESVDSTSPEFLEIKKCLKETHGPTHTKYELEIIDVFRSCKAQEQTSFTDFENKLLLWHGSRVTNWLGILKKGLCIAPPESPVSGLMFGKGLYFADVCSKSANYCYATKIKNEGLLLMCEVSVGNQLKLTRANKNLPEGLPSTCNSVMGKGRVNPSVFNTGVLSSEAKAPFGPLTEDSSYEGSLIYNEYIVYDVKQVKMKYLVRVKFNFK